MTINGLSQELTACIVEVIVNHKKVEKIVVYGSRSCDNFKRISDIDIAIFAKEWTNKDINLVKHSLEEDVKTVLKFDLVNFYDLEKASLKNNILDKGRVIYESRKG
ncbi:MAG: nucleotidyltransferase domain-containing protein [Candidatus Omnitrophica bacterium]|nr:nucleotidyltransferase domain-containing protein [Candidatus Omnitrophota bacterium]